MLRRNLTGFILVFRNYFLKPLVCRAADVKSEVAKHRNPQIKRSVAFCKKLGHKIEDAQEIINRFTEVEAVSADNAKEATEAFTKVGEFLIAMEEMLDHELNMNAVASREKLGWLVVKMLERDPIFQEDADGEKTKEVRSAAWKAAQIYKVLCFFRGA